MNTTTMKIKAILRKTPLPKIRQYFIGSSRQDPPATLEASPLIVDGRLLEAIRENMIYLKYVPPGHYYSPIPAVNELWVNQDRIFDRQKQPLPGITLDDGKMLEQAEHFKEYYPEFPFPKEKAQALRYWTNNGTYSRGDGIILYSMLRNLRPKRIIEVGSGMTSSLMLDVNERFLQNSVQLTFIDPHPELLLSVIRPEDFSKTTIIPKKLQDVDLSIFSELEPNDIAFFDSTHVSKCDSDVNMIFFKILPVLKPGVYIHFHDVFYPFEYPKDWLLNVGAAWNEIYLLRAFLEFNSCFEVSFFNDYMARFHHDRLADTMPEFLDGLAAGIWLKKVC